MTSHLRRQDCHEDLKYQNNNVELTYQFLRRKGYIYDEIQIHLALVWHKITEISCGIVSKTPLMFLWWYITFITTMCSSFSQNVFQVTMILPFLRRVGKHQFSVCTLCQNLRPLPQLVPEFFLNKFILWKRRMKSKNAL